jgi:hypothetical protein
MSSIVSSTNRSKTSYVVESTPGAIPASPVWNEMFVTANQLKLTPVRGRSKDIRSDGQSGGTFLTDLSSAGSIPVEFKFKHWDDFLCRGIKSSWTRKAYRDNNGTAGGNFVTQFHRLFGDGNGDGRVGATDYQLFRTYYGTSNGVSMFDTDGDNIITAADFSVFRSQYGIVLVP